MMMMMMMMMRWNFLSLRMSKPSFIMEVKWDLKNLLVSSMSIGLR